MIKKKKINNTTASLILHLHSTLYGTQFLYLQQTISVFPSKDRARGLNRLVCNAVKCIDNYFTLNAKNSTDIFIITCLIDEMRSRF